MRQDKLEMVKKEMASVNINILGISELKWTGMGEYNSDDHYISYCGQESLRRNGITLIVSKRIWNAVLGCSLKNDRMISVHFQGKPFSVTVIQVYTSTSNADEAEVEWLASLVAQRLKCLPAMRETWVQSLGWEDPLEKEMATHSSVLAWRIPGTGEPGGLLSLGSHRVGHDWSDLVVVMKIMVTSF